MLEIFDARAYNWINMFWKHVQHETIRFVYDLNVCFCVWMTCISLWMLQYVSEHQSHTAHNINSRKEWERDWVGVGEGIHNLVKHNYIQQARLYLIQCMHIYLTNNGTAISMAWMFQRKNVPLTHSNTFAAIRSGRNALLCVGHLKVRKKTQTTFKNDPHTINIDCNSFC